MSSKDNIVVVGAGPTGLGAAIRLTELEHSTWHLYDGCPTPGGLSRTMTDPQGFLWDIGGHVIFSHYQYFDDVMDLAVTEWNTLQREAWVRCCGTWVPYPFQNNIHRLPAEVRDRCLAGVKECQAAKAAGTLPKPANFDEYTQQQFGPGIYDIFMKPYNFKVWAVPLSVMSTEWVGERVASVNVARIEENIKLNKDDVGWGPNATFRYPKTGGTGGIYESIYKMVPTAHKSIGAEHRVVKVDPIGRQVTFAGGQTVPYGTLLSTIPLDDMLRMVADGLEAAKAVDAAPVKPARLREVADKLVFSSTHVIGFGVKGSPPPELQTACWMYFPEDGIPFYRGTIFSRSSDANAPAGHWSLMLEVSQNATYKPVDMDKIMDDCIAGCLKATLLTEKDEIVSKWYYSEHKGYPTPFLGRNDLIQEVLPVLRDSYGIYSRGRFGAWKYEVANQDHSFMQGVEAVSCILQGTPEETLNAPSMVNGRRNEGHCTLQKNGCA